MTKDDRRMIQLMGGICAAAFLYLPIHRYMIEVKPLITGEHRPEAILRVIFLPMIISITVTVLAAFLLRFQRKYRWAIREESIWIIGILFVMGVFVAFPLTTAEAKIVLHNQIVWEGPCSVMGIGGGQRGPSIDAMCEDDTIAIAQPVSKELWKEALENPTIPLTCRRRADGFYAECEKRK